MYAMLSHPRIHLSAVEIPAPCYDATYGAIIIVCTFADYIYAVYLLSLHFSHLNLITTQRIQA